MKRIRNINWLAIIVATLVTGAAVVSWAYLSSRTHQAKLERSLQTKQVELQKQIKALDLQKIQTKQIDDQKEALKVQTQELQKQLEAKRSTQKVLAAAKPTPTKPIQAPRAVYGGDCATWIRDAGITDVASAMELIRKESNCNPNAVNRSSGACGIGQSLPCSKMGAVNANGTSAVSPVNQLIWMDKYVVARYGSFAGALAFHLRNNWY